MSRSTKLGTVFQTLQNYGSSAAPIYFYIFDVLTLSGRKVVDEPLVKRCELLEYSPFLRLCRSSATCSVSFTDTELISHSVEFEARSLYEAGAVALAEFRLSGVIEHIGPAIRFQIEVRRPSTRHEITVSKIEAG